MVFIKSKDRSKTGDNTPWNCFKQLFDEITKLK